MCQVSALWCYQMLYWPVDDINYSINQHIIFDPPLWCGLSWVVWSQHIYGLQYLQVCRLESLLD